MHEFRTQLNRDISRQVMHRVNASANTLSCFQNRDLNPFS
jgi:hypothetical protein